MKNEIKIRLVAEDFGILMRNGMDMVCPLVPPIQFRQIKQGLLGGQPVEEIGIQKSSCNTGCPLLDVGVGKVHVCCGGSKVTHTILEVITMEQQMDNSKKEDNVIDFKNKNIN